MERSRIHPNWVNFSHRCIITSLVINIKLPTSSQLINKNMFSHNYSFNQNHKNRKPDTTQSGTTYQIPRDRYPNLVTLIVILYGSVIACRCSMNADMFNIYSYKTIIACVQRFHGESGLFDSCRRAAILECGIGKSFALRFPQIFG